MTGFWLVLLKAEVLLFAASAILILIAGLVNLVVEYNLRKRAEREAPEEEREENERGIVTKCPDEKRCAAVPDILETDRERERLKRECVDLSAKVEEQKRIIEGQKKKIGELEQEAGRGR